MPKKNSDADLSPDVDTDVTQRSGDARIFDISPVISEKIGVFPGDVEFKRHVAMDFKNGDHLLLSSIQTTLHLGAHADGPNHYRASGEDISERNIRLYMGTCVVLHACCARGERIGWEHLNPKWKALKKWPASRVLVRTESFPDPNNWNSDFCAFTPELIRDWALLGVKLIGIDTPSIDPQDSKTLDAHQMVADHNLAILEGLILSEVPEGLYTLIALPLRLAHADASPVRAILISDTNLLDFNH